MSIIIENNKYYPNYKISVDNLSLIRYVRDNRIGLVNRTIALNTKER